jgi:hypothetical protein
MMGRYKKTARRNKKVLLPRMRRRPGHLRVAQLRRLPWWADPRVMAIVNAKVRP